ncbi:MAG: bifunctional methylenetetrahydrofolate dehydrogenase/methenyltetrahydrofolate cyclohydrolase FolD [Candidatus Aenigmatarchaeota archaeon]
MTQILSGTVVGQKIASQIREEIERLSHRWSSHPGLAVILVGDDPASRIYVTRKEKACREVGILSIEKYFPSNCTEKELVCCIEELNKREEVNGILLQLPLPPHLDANRIIEHISPEKDVDCFHPENIGRLFLGKPRFQPCTPAGILKLLEYYGISVEGKDVVIVGRSNIVGKPLALMMISKNATVTVCHTKSRDLKEKTSRADILISAAGRAGIIKEDMVKEGAVVVDVGITRTEDGKLTGDVDFERVKEKASAITPVPGGVGPMTIAMLLSNTLDAFILQRSQR